MPNDLLQRVSWKSGELFVHGTATHVKQAAAKYLMEQMKVEAARTDAHEKEPATKD